MTARSLLPGLGLALALVAGCTTGEDEDNLPSTTFAGGRVLLAGPDVALRNAALSVDQIKYLGPPPTVEINVHVDDTTTGPDGRFFIDGGQASGQYRLTFRGGEFTDPGTGQVVRLDQADELVTYMDVKIGSRIENHVVSPASVITARVAEQRFATGQDSQFEKSLAFARAHVDAYLGGVAWEFVQPADLTRPAPSPTEAVRAAWLLGAFDLLARDMATAANASPSEVNVHKLLQAWSTDLGAADRPTFDGNDADARGGGLRLGSECPAPDPACVPPPGCSTGACRPRCELYSGSARISLAEAMYGYAKRTAAGHGLPDSDALAAARALQAVNDPLLFAPTACVEDLDRAGPSIVFELPDAAVTDVAGTLTVRARAMDMLDLTPGLTLSVDGATLPDDDGNPSDGLATATIDTQARSGMLKVTARAVDDAGNATTLDRMWLVDNAAPSLTVLADGFLDDGAAWWIRPIGMPPNVPTGPRLTGTVDDAHLRDVRARVGGTDVATATVTGATWEVVLPDGTVPGLAPVTVELVARDHAGNATTVSRVLRRDDTPPVLTVLDTEVRREGGDPMAMPPVSGDAVTFDITTIDTLTGVQLYTVQHAHQGPTTTLGPQTACDATAPTVSKYVHLLDETAPAYVTETGGPEASGRNPLVWKLSLVDDGIGLDAATASYRVVDAMSAAVLLDWRPLPPGTPVLDGMGAVIGRSYAVPLHRRGTTSIAALANDGLYRIELRGADRLGREVAVSRCWNHRVLTAPLHVLPAGPPTNGAGGKWALTNTTLNLGTVGHPIGATVNLGPGVGLMEFPVVNPTAEPVALTIDFEKPASGAAQYTLGYVQDRWVRTTRAVNVNCGNGSFPDGGPDCFLVQAPTGNLAGTPVGPGIATAASLEYDVQIWEVAANGTHTLLSQCPGCDSPAPDGMVRLTVMLPARRAPDGASSVYPARRFVVVAAARQIANLRPAPVPLPMSQVSVAGADLTGTIHESRVGCAVQPTRVGLTWTCSSEATWTRYTAMTSASLTVTGQLRVHAQTSMTGSSPTVPPILAPDANVRTRQFSPWTTSEPTLP